MHEKGDRGQEYTKIKVFNNVIIINDYNELFSYLALIQTPYEKQLLKSNVTFLCFFSFLMRFHVWKLTWNFRHSYYQLEGTIYIRENWLIVYIFT